MSAAWSGTVARFLAQPSDKLIGTLSEHQLRRHRLNEATQLHAWKETVAILRPALAALPVAAGWHLLLEYRLPRLGRTPDAILLLPGAIVVLEVKAGATLVSATDLIQIEDYALDLHDFHAASRAHPILPVLLATDSPDHPLAPALPFGVQPVARVNRATLPVLLADLASAPAPIRPIDPAAWLAAPYHPVPTIVQAACLLYARHDVREIAAARADPVSLSRTTEAITSAVTRAWATGTHVAIFVTGIPGAGKTLCGLNAVFAAAPGTGATFLTGNPTLVHVLREALARDAIDRGTQPRAARQRVQGAIQALPLFRDHYVGRPDELPSDAILVIDEAQRCWSRDHAILKSRDRPVRLHDSEPALLLDILARHPGAAAMICLIGSGQEIHRGEGGLAEWTAALADRPAWRVLAAEAGDFPSAETNPALHLAVAVRQLRSTHAAAWVAAVIDGDIARAADIAVRAGAELPFRLTRSLPAARAALRALSRGTRRVGLVASAGGRRLRAAGLGAELPHMDADAVARWFLDRWPDIRAADALEVVATEFSIQGLELDAVGLCWDGDLIRPPCGSGPWITRAFRGTRWQSCNGEARQNRLNAYRVLLTRARDQTILFIPEGDPADATRDPATLDAVAAFFRACGVAPLVEGPVEPRASPAQPVLL